MPSREELLQSIQPGMRLDKSFFLKIYGYEISFPGFRDIAIKALEDAGCSKAEAYYNMTVSEFERKIDESIRPVAHAYRLKCEEEFERKVKNKERERNDSNAERGKTQFFDGLPQDW